MKLSHRRMILAKGSTRGWKKCDEPDGDCREDLDVELIDQREEEDDELVDLVLFDLAVVQAGDSLSAHLGQE